ncbi:hypothetical protein GA0115246_112486 [Streptomyces sp. SolWspMP-sol7th]|nr:hypothetical protein GA0115246_112486 [Streptomyces sp. SolWspMP-sol7th]
MARAGGRGEDRHQRSGTGPHRTPPARYGPLRLRTRWNVESDGEFFCPDCGGDRAYVRKTGSKYVALLGVPLLPRGTTGPVVECGACTAEYGVEALEHPTTARFGALLRDAVHTVVVAVLAASGTASRSTMDAAVATVRAAGWTDCEDDQLYALMRALAEDPRLPRLPRRPGRGRDRRAHAGHRAPRVPRPARPPPRGTRPRLDPPPGRPRRPRGRPLHLRRARGAERRGRGAAPGHGGGRAAAGGGEDAVLRGLS